MRTLFSNSYKLKATRYILSAILLSGFLTACGGGGGSSASPNTIDNDDSNNPPPDGQGDGETTTTASIVKSIYDTTNSTPYPTAVYLKLKGNALSNFEIRDDQTLVESGALPVGELIGPASGLRSAYSEIERIIVLPDNSDHVVYFSITSPEQVFNIAAQAILVAGKSCMSNQTFYFNYIESELNNRCGSCHSYQGNGSGWNMEEGYIGISDYVANRGEYFYEHPSSQHHGGGRRWDLDDDEVLRMAEFTYRSKHEFNCP